MEGHCLQAMKIVHDHANGRFDWLISGHNRSKEAISILSSKYKRFTFVHPVKTSTKTRQTSFQDKLCFS